MVVSTPLKILQSPAAAPHNAQSATKLSLVSPSAVKDKDVMWLLMAMRPEVPHNEKIEAAKELKNLAKTADDSYWQKNCAQVS